MGLSIAIRDDNTSFAVFFDGRLIGQISGIKGQMDRAPNDEPAWNWYCRNGRGSTTGTAKTFEEAKQLIQSAYRSI